MKDYIKTIKHNPIEILKCASRKIIWPEFRENCFFSTNSNWYHIIAILCSICMSSFTNKEVSVCFCSRHNNLDDRKVTTHVAGYGVKTFFGVAEVNKNTWKYNVITPDNVLIPLHLHLPVRTAKHSPNRLNSNLFFWRKLAIFAALQRFFILKS